ncbi:uncharacterized protein [Oryza sativa Japonica Group]|jgi:hypothetical protein|uniref:Uncharacterized protein n=3 Tax=Oryza TaxID=4527 RepID=A0A0E0P4Z4_ORYRU|nr:hypothetical protein OsI_14721 [Oryza sativa Indica Group]KAF2932667.1 hypothetical protein DAI22_04g015300 [Oryza sativa Japonica Group]
MEGHPLLHHLQQPTLAYTWDPQLAPFDHVAGAGDQVAFSTALELRQALLRALAELDAARAAHQAELRRMESEAARLAALVASAAAERDELRRHCHSLLLLLHHQSQPAAPPTPTPQVSSLPAAHVVAVPAVADELAALDAADEAELEMALARRLPEKGRLVEAVVSAGPLLQTLLLAGPLPRWRHPPPPAPADIPPFNPTKAADADNNSFSSASATSSSPESNCSGGGGHAPLVSPALPYHMIPFCM